MRGRARTKVVIGMGRNLPSGGHAALEWLEAHIAQWNTNQATIGLASATVIDLGQNLANARTLFTSVEQIRADSKSKTQEFNSDMTDIHKEAANAISTIKAYAATTDDPAAVYTLAGLTQADPRQPAPPPAMPTNVLATLVNNGTVDVTWEGSGPVGTVYEVYRKANVETEFTLLGVADARTKEWNDTTLPGAPVSATYQVRAVRGADMSAFSAQSTIQFGPAAGATESEAA